MYTEQRPFQSSTPSPAAIAPWELQAIKRAHLLHGQLRSAIELAASSSVQELSQMNFMGAQSPYMHQLARLYSEGMALAKLLDSSDLLLHAEGPGAAQNNPRLSAVNWLCTGAEKHIKRLLEAVLPLADKSSHTASKSLDLRLTGLAPGSLYAGFALAGLTTVQRAASLMPQEDAALLDWLRKSIHALPIVPQFVGTDGMDKQIMEALPDPALRDAALVAAYEMTPNGRKGIHTIEISAPRADDSRARLPQPMGLKEHVVLREAIRGEPMMRRSKKGSFTGILRALDLDSNRITIRDISADTPSLRGVLTDSAAAKGFMDKWVKIEGAYEMDANDKPRMMRVESIALVEQPLRLID